MIPLPIFSIFFPLFFFFFFFFFLFSLFLCVCVFFLFVLYFVVEMKKSKVEGGGDIEKEPDVALSSSMTCWWLG